MSMTSTPDRSPVTRVVKQRELQVWKFRQQPVAIHLGVDVDDENFCAHEIKSRDAARLSALC
jgi:hypothetical protein